MADVKKLRFIESQLQTIFQKKTAEGVNMEELSKQTGLFSVEQPGNIDEPFEITVKGVEITTEDEDTASIDGVHEEELDKHFDNEVDEIMDALEVQTDKVLSPDKRIKIKKLLARVQAQMVTSMNYNAGEWWVDVIQNEIRNLEPIIAGFAFDEWDEMYLYFNIDGERYSMSAFDGAELTRTSDGLTITEIEDAQNKPAETTPELPEIEPEHQESEAADEF